MLSEPQFAVFTVLCIVLVGSALLARRPPAGTAAKMAAAWVVIFAVAFGLFAFRDEFAGIGSRLKSELWGSPMEQGGELRVPISNDGHFWVRASINGVEDRFLVDTGATMTTISQGLADRAGVRRGIGGALVDTANGRVAMRDGRARLSLGPIVRPDFRLHINQGDETNVIGMNFMASLSSWRVEGHDLVLVP